MYKIRFNNKKKYYTVVYLTKTCSLPFFQSSDYDKCVEYINQKTQEQDLYDECGFNYRDKSPYYDKTS